MGLSFKIPENPVDITNSFIKVLYNSVHQLGGYGTTDELPLIFESSVIQDSIFNLKKQCKRVRYITDIKKTNLENCKKMMENTPID